MVFSSCEYRTGSEQRAMNDTTTKIDMGKVNYINSIADKGFVIFKKNCAICHCSVNGTCEDQSGFRFQNIFNKLPKDSLESYIKFVKDSKTSGLKYTAESEHKFETKLTDKEIETVIEYLWLQCQARN